MNIKSDKAGTPIGFVLVGSLGLGLSYGAIKSFNLSLWGNLLSAAAVLAIQWAIYSRGKATSYAQAQAWAQNEVDIAIEITNTATAQANALSEAYASAIASANATAINEVVINVPEQKSLDQLISEGLEDIANRPSESPRVAEPEFTKKEYKTLWARTDT